CMARISDLNEMSVGTLNIGVTYSFSPILTETIISFMRQYPHIKLNIYYKPMEELMDMLRKQSVDFALAFKPTKPIEGIESHILFQNCLSAIVDRSHPLAAQNRVTLLELEKYDLALPAQGLQARNYFDQIISSHKNLRVRVELNEVNILLKLLRQTQLVSVLAEATINNETGVKAIPLDIAQNEMTGCIHTLKDTYRKHSMVEFVKMLSESIAVRERQKAWI
ncbi:MAG: LysR family transcriptional regulator, partial [Muribaculaceae bacterium]|nr:LysR family transcriptional regulator [Muribaculaceae bacterium]